MKILQIAAFVVAALFGHVTKSGAGVIPVYPLGATVTNGSTVRIHWHPPVGVDSVEISIGPDVYHSTTVNENATNSGEYIWQVNSGGYDLKYGQTYFIEIRAITTSYSWVGRTAYFTIIEDPGALPVILTPTNSQVAYVGDDLTITWKPTVAGKGATNVHIAVNGNIGGHYFGASVPNTGTYTWTVWKSGAGQEQFTLTIADGASVTNKASVQLVIPNLPRPRPVATSIRRVVSVEWVSVPGHVYRIESTTNLTSWVTEFEDTASDTNSLALFYAEGPNTYFKVLDLTP